MLIGMDQLALSLRKPLAFSSKLPGPELERARELNLELGRELGGSHEQQAKHEQRAPDGAEQQA